MRFWGHRKEMGSEHRACQPLQGCCIFIAPSSFPAKKYKKVTGKEIYSDTLESTAMLEKEKFPQHYFPEVRTPHPHRPGPSPWHGPA